MNLHLTPEILDVIVYHLCYCLQSLILLLRKNLFFSSLKTSQQSVRITENLYAHTLYSISPWFAGCINMRAQERYWKLNICIWCKQFYLTFSSLPLFMITFKRVIYSNICNLTIWVGFSLHRIFKLHGEGFCQKE